MDPVGFIMAIEQDYYRRLLNTYSIKQSDLYYFDTIKMTSQAQLNFSRGGHSRIGSH